MNASLCCNGTMASFIISIPMNKIPRPAKISPKALTFLPLRNVTSTTPKIATSGAILDASRAISCPVIVVPILAPMMIQTAWFNVISCEFTKPTTITVVAEELWITAVMAAPTIMPRKRLLVSLSRMVFIRSPAAPSRPELIICIPYRNRARPPNNFRILSNVMNT